jgi:hypothetical protein
MDPEQETDPGDLESRIRSKIARMGNTGFDIRRLQTGEPFS